MNPKSSDLDSTDWAILTELQADARLSFSELGRRVGLSSPAVAERVRRLEDVGVITGYHAQVNLTNIGLPLQVFVRILTRDAYQSTRFGEQVCEIPEILECHKVTGEDCYLLRAAIPSIEHLDALIDCLKNYADGIVTSLVLTSPMTRKVIQPPY